MPYPPSLRFIIFASIVGMLVIFSALLWLRIPNEASITERSESGAEALPSIEKRDVAVVDKLLASPSAAIVSPSALPPELSFPMERSLERVTRKPFGIFIDPKTSPVQPERFRGYHTGIDFEVLPDEIGQTVAVFAICAGEVREKRWAAGYGGVVVTTCDLENKPVTVVYGHLDLGTVAARVGERVALGNRLGVLGLSGSADTDGERQHLHLGLVSGTRVNLRGYVATPAELSAWIDPCLWFCPQSQS